MRIFTICCMLTVHVFQKHSKTKHNSYEICVFPNQMEKWKWVCKSKCTSLSIIHFMALYKWCFKGKYIYNCTVLYTGERNGNTKLPVETQEYKSCKPNAMQTREHCNN